jgi:imidazolonepropionase-like amidohydrolase
MATASPSRPRLRALRHVLVLALLVLSIVGAGPPANPRAFVIRHVRVFDGQRLLSARDVLVADGKIRAIGTRLRTPPGTMEIDATGQTLLPGLIDAHTHDWGESAKQALRFGVTTELNQAAPLPYLTGRKRAQAEGKAGDSADVISAGGVVTPPGGHGTEYGIPVPTLADAQDAQRFVDERIAEGSAHIKIVLDDGRACGQTYTRLSDAALLASVAAAHKRGKVAVVHVGTEADARAAITAGADGIAHLFADAPPTAELVALMRRRKTFAITTLTPIQTSLGTISGLSLVEDHRLAPRLTPIAQNQLKEPMPFRCTGELAHAFAAMKQLHDVGVPILAGSDAPAPGGTNGVSLHGELELLVKGGLSPSEALAAATSVPARAFRLTDRGRIVPGLRADLLLVRGDPTRDITATRDIVEVWKAGVAVSAAPRGGPEF